MGWDYTEKVKDHFMNPRNVGRIDDADGIGEVGSVACGDALTLSIKVDDEKKVISDAKFQTFGCGSAIASSSVLTEMVKGMHIDDAVELNEEVVEEAVGGLPEAKKHCSNLGPDALYNAVINYVTRHVEKQADDSPRTRDERPTDTRPTAERGE